MAIRHWHLDSGAIRINNFPENEIQIGVIACVMASETSIAIDSTGVKAWTSRHYVPPEMVKHAKQGILIARASTPSATDAVVNVELYDDTAADVVASIQYAGVGGVKSTTLDQDTVKQLAGHNVHIRINVVTASATAGASQGFQMAEFLVILGIS